MTAAPVPASELRQLELELELARAAEIYLVVDPAARRLEIKARGMVLDTVPLEGVALLRWGRLLGRGEAPELPLPARLRVERGAGRRQREIIAPTELRPYRSDEEAPAEALDRPPSKQTRPPLDGEPVGYSVTLDNGWRLRIGDSALSTNFFARLAAAFREGWARLGGLTPSRPPLIAVAVTSEDARRIRHLLHDGRIILVTAG